MKTLLIYTGRRSAVRTMCEGSAAENVDVFELCARYKKIPVLSRIAETYRAVAGKGLRLAPLDVDLASYTNVILVDSLEFSSPSAVCNEFLYRCDLSGREVSCIVCSRFRNGAAAQRVLRKRVRLAGGICRNMVFITETDLNRAPEASAAFVLQKQRT